MEYQLAVKEKKGPQLMGKVAVNMAQAADLATERVLNSRSPNRAQQIAELGQLLAEEQPALNAVANSSWTTVAQQGQALQWQVQTDEQRLAAAK
jgi:hypothetical protein